MFPRNVIAILLAALVGCFPMGSRVYQPVSRWETEAMSRAEGNIFPDDVRKDIEKYRSTTIVWTGIVKKCQTEYEEDRIIVNFDLEHRYYDWVEDFHAMNRPIWLDSKGEGPFVTSWELKKNTDKEVIEENSKPGTLLIVYGTPTKLEGKTIFVKAFYVRPISASYYQQSPYDIGRAPAPTERYKKKNQ